MFELYISWELQYSKSLILRYGVINCEYVYIHCIMDKYIAKQYLLSVQYSLQTGIYLYISIYIYLYISIYIAVMNILVYIQCTRFTFLYFAKYQADVFL